MITASIEALKSQQEFEVLDMLDNYCEVELCYMCEADFDPTDLIYCEGCSQVLCEDCFEYHLIKDEECRMRNGAD